MLNKWRFLVMGCGSIGQRHIKNLLSLQAGEVIVFDTYSVLLEQIQTQFPTVTVITDLAQAWSHDPNVALITTPTHLHLNNALTAAQHNCHLFIEKPVAHTLTGLDELIQEIQTRHLISLVGCNMRFHPGPKFIKSFLNDGQIGEVISARIHTGSYLPRWRPHQDYRQSYSASHEQGGGAVLDCIHELDLALWYFGAGRLVGSAILPATSIGLTVEGVAEILLQHENGVLSSTHLNFIQQDYRRSCQIMGSEGSLYWDFDTPVVRYYKSDGTWQTLELPTSWQVNDMFVDEMAYFVDCLNQHRPTFNSVETAKATLKIALEVKN